MDFEHYFKFKATHIVDKDKLTVATMFLSGDAKMWWTRSKDDKDSGRDLITTWEDMKKEICNQFLPHHASRIARDKRKDLNQTRKIRDYVKVLLHSC